MTLRLEGKRTKHFHAYNETASDFTHTHLHNIQKYPVQLKFSFVHSYWTSTRGGTSLTLGAAMPSRDIHGGILKSITKCSFTTSKEAYAVKSQKSPKFQTLKESTLYCFQDTQSVSFKHYLYDAEAVYISHLRLWSRMTKLFAYTAYSKNKHRNTI